MRWRSTGSRRRRWSGARCARAALFAAVLAGCSRYEWIATWNEVRGDAYALDDVPRELPEGAAASCPDQVPVVDYRGELMTYSAPVEVAAAFVPKLRRLEQLVVEVASEHYGRAPDRLVHFGARVCRTVRGGSRRLSEHALGNALDLSGFEWRRKPGAERYPQRFAVSVLRHWDARDGDPESERHAQFWRDLVARIEEDGVFRGIIGPGREGHENHLHLDHAPWSYTRF